MVGKTKLSRETVLPVQSERRLTRVLFGLCVIAMLAGTVDAIRWTVTAEREDLLRERDVAVEQAAQAEKARIEVARLVAEAEAAQLRAQEQLRRWQRMRLARDKDAPKVDINHDMLLKRSMAKSDGLACGVR